MKRQEIIFLFINFLRMKNNLHKIDSCFTFAVRFCPDGGIGRRIGLKHQRDKTHAGSSPALGTSAI